VLRSIEQRGDAYRVGLHDLGSISTSAARRAQAVAVARDAGFG